VTPRAPAAAVLACVLASAATGAAQPATSAEPAPIPRFADPARRATLERALPEIRALVEGRVRSFRAPGASYAVVIDGHAVLLGGTGVREAGGDAAVGADTVFRIASMTKSFTALAVLRLRDEGRLSLDHPASRYLPELAAMPLPTRDAPAITVRHLMTHAAGFPEDNPWGDRQLAVSDATVGTWLRAGLPFSTSPGTAYEYSNYGFALLGRIVSRVSGVPYQQYVTEHILRPLGMTSTVWAPESVPPGRLAMGHRYEDGRWTPEPPLGDGAFGAMGGLFTTARDLSRYVAFMLSAWPPRDDEDGGPVSRSSLREMQQPQQLSGFGTDRDAPDGPLRAITRSYGYGLAVVRDCRFPSVVSHGGGLPGYGSTMAWLPEYGVGLLVLANVTYAPAGAVVRPALDLLDQTGALRPRVLPASRALVEVRDAIAGLVHAWDDGAARRMAADNLALDRPLDRRREELAALRARLGACRADGDVAAENWLRGTFRMQCDRGWLDVSVTLAPTSPPGVQHLEFTPGEPLGAQAARAVERLAALTTAWDDAAGAELVAAPLASAAVRRQLEAVRLRYGACRAGDTLEGDGARRFSVRFECERGAMDVRVGLDEAGTRLAALAIRRAFGETCAQ
jgi:CubicO group peptidase (beta-lactamase class C family)